MCRPQHRFRWRLTAWRNVSVLCRDAAAKVSEEPPLPYALSRPPPDWVATLDPGLALPWHHLVDSHQLFWVWWTSVWIASTTVQTAVSLRWLDHLESWDKRMRWGRRSYNEAFRPASLKMVKYVVVLALPLHKAVFLTETMQFLHRVDQFKNSTLPGVNTMSFLEMLMSQF